MTILSYTGSPRVKILKKKIFLGGGTKGYVFDSYFIIYLQLVLSPYFVCFCIADAGPTCIG